MANVNNPRTLRICLYLRSVFRTFPTPPRSGPIETRDHTSAIENKETIITIKDERKKMEKEIVKGTYLRW